MTLLNTTAQSFGITQASWRNSTAIDALLRSPGAPVHRQPEQHAELWARLAEAAARNLLEQELRLVPRIEEAHGFTRREAIRAIRSALEPITATDLIEIWDNEIDPYLSAPFFSTTKTQTSHLAWPDLTVVFGGGAIPQPSVQNLIAAGMISRKVLYRPSKQDSILAPLLVQMMDQVLEQFRGMMPYEYQRADSTMPSPIASRVLCATWSHDEIDLTRRIVSSADALVIFGDDRTTRELTRHASEACQSYLYGPRISFAVLDLTRPVNAETLRRSLTAFADDVVAYDQRGCLSPAALYLLGGSPEQRRQATESLADALEMKASTQGCAIDLPAEAAATISSLRSIYQMDASGLRKLYSSATVPGWTILYDEMDPTLRPTPGYQTIHVKPVSGWDELVRSVTPADDSKWELQAMAVGPGGHACPDAVAEYLIDTGLSRICPFGHMQCPPLDWTHDGNPFFPWQFDLG